MSGISIKSSCREVRDLSIFDSRLVLLTLIPRSYISFIMQHISYLDTTSGDKMCLTPFQYKFFSIMCFMTFAVCKQVNPSTDNCQIHLLICLFENNPLKHSLLIKLFFSDDRASDRTNLTAFSNAFVTPYAH